MNLAQKLEIIGQMSATLTAKMAHEDAKIIVLHKGLSTKYTLSDNSVAVKFDETFVGIPDDLRITELVFDENAQRYDVHLSDGTVGAITLLREHDGVKVGIEVTSGEAGAHLLTALALTDAKVLTRITGNAA